MAPVVAVSLGIAMMVAAPCRADEDPVTESPAQCATRTKSSAVDCFVTQARYQLLLCQLKTKLALMSGDHSDAASCKRAPQKFTIDDYYKATLRQFGKNKDAQTKTKDFYALWRGAMSGMAPNADEVKIVYETRANKLVADVQTAGERLLLEK